MISGSRKLPTQHISIRVPWHDNGWNGTVCQKPGSNHACRVLPRVAEGKDDTKEIELAGCSFEELEQKQLPPCINERGGFMAPFALVQRKKHPYAESSPKTHGHFASTPYTIRPYSAACVPFRWMLEKNSPELVEQYNLGYQQAREPELPFDSSWIQDRSNQLIMLDTFFGAIQPEESLCFFYAKDTPLSSTSGRVIVGVGLVRSVGNHVEYKYETDSPDLRGVLWERNVEHSIRTGFQEGFLFPYQELFDISVEEGFDPEPYVAFAPSEAFWSFSYSSEHVPHDHAIASILSCMRALEKIGEVLSGPWKRIGNWLDQQLNRLWKMRGPYPGFGSALTAFLGQGGNIVAYEIMQKCTQEQPEGNIDPWPEFERLMRAPDLAEGAARNIIGEGFERAWLAITPVRKSLLKLLSRFSLSADQASRFFKEEERPGEASDWEIIRNPYLLYELDRESLDAISIETIDRGMLPDRVVQEAHPLPDESKLQDKVDPRRVRALMVATLEQAADEGHTLLPRSWLSRRINNRALDTDCPVGQEVLAGMRELLKDFVSETEMADGSIGYQLSRLEETGALIRRTVQKRTGTKSKRHTANIDFQEIVDKGLGELPEDKEDKKAELQARKEKAVALQEIFESRLSVLIGPAGTGKTTLLRMLCSLPEVQMGGILLLAPTGKARVQLETKTGREGGMTVAQLLMRYGSRYNPNTGQYRVTKNTNRCSDYKTVVVDECSMLTEEQLAALLDGLSGYTRLILVGDPRQLPPIGSGRPFVDIVRTLAPEGVEHSFPRVGRGYAELTIPRRQQGQTRADLLLAGWFGGISDPAADEIWDRLETETNAEIRFESWENGEDLQEKLINLVVEELNLNGQEDEAGFGVSLGGSLFEDTGVTFFWRSRDGGSLLQPENWQIISPVRAAEHGVEAINRLVQQTFRKGWLERAAAHPKYRKIHPPKGRHGIIYGDKVINLYNSGKRRVYPNRNSYVANGDVGIVVGGYKRKGKLFHRLEVEFSSQPTFSYDYPIREFGDEGSDPLELAYALTVHKSQGSEFGITFVVLPNPCWVLSKELLYTALTRQQNRVIILHQGDIRTLRRYASEQYSDIARRLTNLFNPANPVAFDVDGNERFLEEGLIHKTKKGDLVRSKSEVIIANELFNQGIDRYEYEIELVLANGEKRYPDFTIIDDDTGESYYWEHLGLLHNPDYAARWERKLAAYRAADILPYEEGGGEAGTLIMTRDDERGGIDAQAISEMISEIFDL
ncbi:MAG: RNA helicase [Deltaproteobacteria bacterium]|nr:MAG: RNA helicase [Deltaproteobacteria bacterium]